MIILISCKNAHRALYNMTSKMCTSLLGRKLILCQELSWMQDNSSAVLLKQ